MYLVGRLASGQLRACALEAAACKVFKWNVDVCNGADPTETLPGRSHMLSVPRQMTETGGGFSECVVSVCFSEEEKEGGWQLLRR